MIETFKRCRGLRVPLWGNRQLEVWFCPKGETVPPHTHKNIDSFIMALWGAQRWTVGNKTRNVIGPLRLRESTRRLALAAYHVGRGVRHAFTAKSFSVFLNVERCDGAKVSAATDFVLVP